MATLVWPNFYAEEIDWRLYGGTVSGGTSLGGVTQVGHLSGGPMWRVSLGAIVLATRDDLLAARAMQAALDGGATPVIVAANECWFTPQESATGVPHSDDSPFSDDALYSGGTIEASFGASAALRAASVTLNLTGATSLRGGEHFSVDHAAEGRRMYRIMGITGGTDEAPVVSIRPLLREAVSSGDLVDFNRPSCLMHLVGELAVPSQHGVWAETGVTFEEWFGEVE